MQDWIDMRPKFLLQAIKALVKEAGGRLDPDLDEFDDEDIQMDNVIDNAMDHESSRHQ